MVQRDKEVTWRHLKKGMKLKGYRIGNSRSFATYVVESANAATVSMLIWGKDPVQVSAEDAIFFTEMTGEEFAAIHREKAKVLYKALQKDLAEYEIGPHKYDNSWISYDPYEMAAKCADQELTVIGVCRTIPGKIVRAIASLDIGICAEEPNGHRFWCHASSFHLDMMLEEHKSTLGGQKNEEM